MHASWHKDDFFCKREETAPESYWIDHEFSIPYSVLTLIQSTRAIPLAGGLAPPSVV